MMFTLPTQLPTLAQFGILFLIAFVAGAAWAIGTWVGAKITSYRRGKVA
jgi:hypothetical protein